jgi:UDP-N-acetyl-2-amino-2-deoxyglucuronate dehydrogenase
LTSEQMEYTRLQGEPHPSRRETALGIGVGIIGAGSVSNAHAAAYLSCRRRATLTAIADVDVSRAQALRRRTGAEAAFADYHELLGRSDIDAVSICTPAATHAEIVLDAIRAGKHVLCEKPIATRFGDAGALIDASAGHPELCVSCVFQHRDDPALRRARWILGERVIGDVFSAHLAAHVHRNASYYQEGRGDRQTDGGGALIVQGIHLLDALVWMLGDVSSVSGTMGTFIHDIQTEDAFVGWARLSGGAAASIECSTGAPRDDYAFDILGREACLSLRYRPGWARMWELDVRCHDRRQAWAIRRGAERRFPPATRLRAPHTARLAASRVTRSPRRPGHLGHTPHISRFLDAVESGGASPVSPSEACRSLELVEALYRSASGRVQVDLPLVRERASA